MSWEVIIGELSLLSFLFLSSNPWGLFPALVLLITDPLKLHRFKPLAVAMASGGLLLFLFTYTASPYLGGGLFISYLMAAEYIWRGKGPWRDWVHLSSLLLMANCGILAQGFYFLFLALVFAVLSLLRLYDSLYPGKRLLWGFLLIHLSLSLLLAPLIFLFTPRKGLINLGFVGGAVSGPSSSVDLNFSGKILPSSQIVMEIRGKSIPTYWKTRVFYLYYGGRWVNVLRGRARTGKERVKIKIRNKLKIYLYLKLTPALPLPPGGWSVILQAPGYWSYGHFIEFSKPKNYYETFPTPGKIMVLRPEGGEFVLLGQENPYLRRETRIYLPEKTAERIRKLAGTLKGKSLSESLSNVKKFLQENYRYSLEVKREGEDPLEGFLFKNHQGHCELFATAAAALLYAMGKQVRMVIGFRISEKGKGWAIARMKDAHAWVEVWDGGRWSTFDPSPYVPEKAGFLSKGLMGNLQLLWDKYILSFSYYQQLGIFLWIRRNKGKILLFVLAAVILGWFVRKGLSIPSPKQRERRFERGSTRKMPWYYRRMIKIVGIKKPPWQTPLEFSRVLGKEAEIITSFYYRERFGKIYPSKTDQEKIKEALDRLEDRLKRSKGQG